MIKYCYECKEKRLFDNSWDEDCIRCLACGCLPYDKEGYELHKRGQK